MITYLKLHIFELKYNFFFLIISFLYLFLICSFFSDQILYLFIKPLLKLTNLKYFIYTNIIEFFILHFNISIIISLYLIFPISLIQIWFLFSKGFTKKENLKIIKIFIIFIFIVFIFSFFLLIKIIPFIWYYFFNINFKNNYLFNFYLEPKIIDYFFFICYIYIYLFIFFFFICYILTIKKIINIKMLIYIRIFLWLLLFSLEIYNQYFIFFFILYIFELYIYYYIVNYYKAK
jgi:Sec-independent protein secretion pathway component TatC